MHKSSKHSPGNIAFILPSILHRSSSPGLRGCWGLSRLLEPQTGETPRPVHHRAQTMYYHQFRVVHVFELRGKLKYLKETRTDTGRTWKLHRKAFWLYWDSSCCEETVLPT